MVGSFNFSHLPSIIFGIGSRDKLVKSVKQYGNKVLLITGESSFNRNKKAFELLEKLQVSGIEITRISIKNEPTPDDIDSVVSPGKDKSVSCVVAVGGGSVMDAGKAISAMLTVDGSVKDYLEGVGRYGHPGTKVPFIALPTTAGTGSEATKNAVITEPGNSGFKKSLRHENFIPDLAIVDPELTVSCSPKITSAGGMDAFTQLLESYLSLKANPLTDSLALEGIQRIMQNVEPAVYDGYNLEAREGMAYAALLSGITLANAGLGVVHGFAQPLGSLYSIPHGVVCGTLMGVTNKITLQHILRSKKEPHTYTLNKYARLGSLLVNKEGKTEYLAGVFIDYLLELTDKFALPRLSEYGIKGSKLGSIIAATSQKYHPVNLSDGELEEILKERL